MTHEGVCDIDVDEVKKKESSRTSGVRMGPSSLGSGLLGSQQFFNQSFFGRNISKADLTTKVISPEKGSERNSVAFSSVSCSAIISSAPPIPSITKNMKILILGNAKCGKSSLINRYCNGTFNEKYKTTVGADFIRKDISYKRKKRDNAIGIRLQLWDIAGQDRFQKLTRAYFSKAKGVAIVCDLNRDGTIEAVRQWKQEVTEWATASGNPNMPVILFANKCDLLNKADPQSAFRMGVYMERVCREENFLAWFMTSARSGEGVIEGFNVLIDNIVNTRASDATEKRVDADSLSRNDKCTESDRSNTNIKLSPNTATPISHRSWCY